MKIALELLAHSRKKGLEGNIGETITVTPKEAEYLIGRGAARRIETAQPPKKQPAPPALSENPTPEREDDE